MVSIIKIDLDHNKRRAVRKIKLIVMLFDKVLVRRSANGGYHVKIFLDQDLPVGEILKLRKMLGDDVRRIELDKERIKHGIVNFDVLFDEKNGKKAEEWTLI